MVGLVVLVAAVAVVIAIVVPLTVIEEEEPLPVDNTVMDQGKIFLRIFFVENISSSDDHWRSLWKDCGPRDDSRGGLPTRQLNIRTDSLYIHGLTQLIQGVPKKSLSREMFI